MEKLINRYKQLKNEFACVEKKIIEGFQKTVSFELYGIKNIVDDNRIQFIVDDDCLRWLDIKHLDEFKEKAMKEKLFKLLGKRIAIEDIGGTEYYGECTGYSYSGDVWIIRDGYCDYYEGELVE